MTSGLSSRHLATRAGFPMVAMCRHASGGGLNGDTSFWWDHCRSTKSRCPLAPKTGPARCCCRAVPAKLSGSIGSPDLSLEPPSGRIHGSKRPGCRMPAALRAADRRSMPSGDALRLSAFIKECRRTLAWAALCHLLERRSTISADVVALSAAMNLFAQAQQWSRALQLLQRAPAEEICPNEQSYHAVLTACDKASADACDASSGCSWRRALLLFLQMCEARLEANPFVQCAVVSAVGSAPSSPWPWTLHCLQPTWAPLAARNAAAAGVGKRGRWRVAEEVLMRRSIQLDSISFNSLADVFVKGSLWQLSLNSIKEMTQQQLQVQRITDNTALSAYECASLWAAASAALKPRGFNEVSLAVVLKSCPWRQATDLARRMPMQALRPNAIIQGSLMASVGRQRTLWHRALRCLGRPLSLPAGNAALGALRKDSSWRLCLALADDLLLQRLPSDAVGRTELVTAAMKAEAWPATIALLEVPGARVSEPREVRSLPELVALLYSAASLGGDISLLGAELDLVEQRLHSERLSVTSLASLAWACATLQAANGLKLLDLVAQQLLCAEGSDGSADADVAEAWVTCSWSFHMLGLTSLELPQLQRLRRALLRLGAARDARQRRPVLPALPLGTVRRSVQEEPRLLLDLPDAVVFQKPSGYQIDDRGRGADPEAPEDRGNAALFLEAMVPPGRSPISGDLACKLGFLHRLDLPSSGLILCATNYRRVHHPQPRPPELPRHPRTGELEPRVGRAARAHEGGAAWMASLHTAHASFPPALTEPAARAARAEPGGGGDWDGAAASDPMPLCACGHAHGRGWQVHVHSHLPERSALVPPELPPPAPSQLRPWKARNTASGGAAAGRPAGGLEKAGGLEHPGPGAWRKKIECGAVMETGW
ncbi:unnamed protein product [Durusdinium trenchii]|uniref:Uncharacterized protein n=1 Tax=Durusdinium trenchii TaxID=1381693 RepID=A0ABP0REV5_9DINO